MATKPQLSLMLTYLAAVLKQPSVVNDQVLGNRVAWAMKYALDIFGTKKEEQIQRLAEPGDLKDIQAMLDKLRSGEKP